MEELISVIVPIYKVEAYLERCIRSIVNQTYKNLEIILVDLQIHVLTFVMSGKKKMIGSRLYIKKMAVCLMQEMQECRL